MRLSYSIDWFEVTDKVWKHLAPECRGPWSWNSRRLGGYGGQELRLPSAIEMLAIALSRFT
ncbi:MAG: hypothetical protein ISR41_06975 [Puniceicoccaceae bacterium]|nr:hypothetical protein [Puniceicoccaceae bacterium]